MELSNLNISSNISCKSPTCKSSNSSVSKSTSSDNGFKKALNNTIQSTNSKSTDEKIQSPKIPDSSEKVETECESPSTNQTKNKDSTKKTEDLITEIVGIINSLGNIKDIQNLKNILSTDSKDTTSKDITNKIADSLEELLSQVEQYSNLSQDQKSDIQGKLLQQIENELPEKLTLTQSNDSFSSKLKQIITSILTSKSNSPAKGEDDSLVNSIKAEISNILKGNSEDDKSIEGAKSVTNQVSGAIGKQIDDVSSHTNTEKTIVTPEDTKLTAQSTDTKTSKKDAELISLVNTKQNESVNVSGNDANNQITDTENKVSSLSAKEEKLLKDLVVSKDKNSSSDIGISTSNKDTDSKIQKVTMFSSILNNIKNDNISVPETIMYISKDNIVNDIIKSVKYMETNNVKDMTVKIMPKELGEVVIKITMEGGVMKANLTVNSKEAYNIINSNLSDINSKLSNQDIKIQNFTINIYQDSTFFNGDSKKENSEQQNSKNGNNHSKLAIDEDILDSDEKIDGRVNILV